MSENYRKDSKEEKKKRRVQWSERLIISDERITRKCSERAIDNNFVG